MERYKGFKELDSGVDEEKLKKAHDTDFIEPYTTLDDWPKVFGYDFNKKFDIKEFLESFYHTGFQATHLYKAIKLIRKMREENATIFFAFTSNMISCGVREIIAYLAQHKFVDVIVTTAGGIEEDVIKTMKPFVLGDYDAPGKFLREKAINRTGNIFIPNDRYIYFERFMNKFLQEMLDKQKKEGRILSSDEFIKELGLRIEDKKSFLYWASRNNIPVFCPAITDGSLGDVIYFFKYKHPEFRIDNTDELVKINNIALNSEKTGVIVIGGSLPKHYVANANLFRGGADYAVYITTAIEYEGSNAGANPDEAVSWGKFKNKENTVKVWGEASIVFPLIVLGAFKDDL